MATEDFKRKLTAIFSADVAGYSRLMGEDEAATVKTLASYREVMASLIKQHRGRVIDSPGDNVLAEFVSVVDAVQSAVAVQNELQTRNAELPESRRMEFRIGINLGDVIDEEDRIYGDGVNIAARLESLADPGGICISKTAFDQIETKLPLGYEFLGEQDVKNIAKPVGAYRVLLDAEAAGKVIGEVRPKTKQLRGVAIGAVAVLIIVAGALAIWNFYLRPAFEPASEKRMAFQLPDQPSIAVLPFDNLSLNNEHDSLGDAISESIIYTLSYLPGMFVISRNSAFTYKGKPVEIRQVAEELGVRYVLEGSVMRAEDRVRVTAQLIDAISGYHIWSGRFDRTINDFFGLLDDITKTIAIELQVKVSDKWADLTSNTGNFDAWASTTRAYSLILRSRENVVEARGLARKAVALDPKYAFGWAILAVVHTLELLYGVSESPAESIKLAAEANEKALNLEPTLSCATGNRGQIYLLQGRIEEAVALGEKAIAMAPGLETNYLIMGIIMDFAGRFEEAAVFYKKAMRLNPLYTAGYIKRYGMSCLMADRHEEALTAFKELLARAQRGEHPPLFPHLGLSAVYAELGKKEEARIHTSEILKIDPNFSLVAARKAYRWKDPSNTERWLSSLRNGGLPETPPLQLPDKPSIAVLAFTNMSGDPEQEYFSDGITENIITALSKLDRLFVIARNSAFTYKGKSVMVQQVGRDLGVRYVLEGSVLKSEDRVRVTAQLIDTTTGHHVWAESYDRKIEDIFELQDDITLNILKSLHVKLAEGEQARFFLKGTKNLKAYLMVWQAIDHFRRFTPEHIALCRKVAEEAISLDPDNPDAYAMVAWSYLLEVNLGWAKSPKTALKIGEEMTHKVLELETDESMAHGHYLMSYVYLIKQEFEEAITEIEKAVAVYPNGADVAAFYGLALRYAGRYDKAIEWLKKAIRFNPIPPNWYLHNLGFAYMYSGRYSEAIAQFEKALQNNPNHFPALLGLASTYSMMDKREEARVVARKILSVNPKFNMEKYEKAVVVKDQAAKERYLAALRKAGLK
jgi:adenylate cyclase